MTQTKLLFLKFALILLDNLVHTQSLWTAMNIPHSIENNNFNIMLTCLNMCAVSKWYKFYILNIWQALISVMGPFNWLLYIIYFNFMNLWMSPWILCDWSLDSSLLCFACKWPGMWSHRMTTSCWAKQHNQQ